MAQSRRSPQEMARARNVSTQTEDPQQRHSTMHVHGPVNIVDSYIRSLTAPVNEGPSASVQRSGLGETGARDNVNDLIGMLRRSPEFQQLVVDVFENNGVTNTSQQTSPRFLATEDGVRETFIAELVKRAYVDLTRNDPARQSNYLLNKLYEEERAAAQLSFEGRRDLEEPFSKLWDGFCFKLIAQTSNRSDDGDNAPVQLCAEISREMLQKKPPQGILENFIQRASDFVSLGQEFVANGCLVHALISYDIGAQLHKLAGKGDDSVRGINTCSLKMYLLADKIAQANAILVENHVIPTMREFIRHIQAMESASRPEKVDKEAWCRSRLALCFYLLKDFHSFAEENKLAIRLLETEFPDEAKSHVVFGRCLHNVGVAYERMRRPQEALGYCKMAFEAYEGARDWGSEQLKNGYLSKLRDLRNKCENPRPMVSVC